MITIDDVRKRDAYFRKLKKERDQRHQEKVDRAVAFLDSFAAIALALSHGQFHEVNSLGRNEFQMTRNDLGWRKSPGWRYRIKEIYKAAKLVGLESIADGAQRYYDLCCR